MRAPLRVEKLRRDHAVDAFDCGRDQLNRFLIRFALPNQQANASQTYVGLSGDSVIGFYTLVVGQVTYDGAPERLTKGSARHPMPIMLLARLAVGVDWQGQGVGAGLLKDAMLRTLRAADIAGIRAFAVHAKDEDARRYYERFGFVMSPSDPFHLFVLIKDLRRITQGLASGESRAPRICGGGISDAPNDTGLSAKRSTTPPNGRVDRVNNP